MAAAPPPDPSEFYLTFCSGIDQAGVGRLMLTLDVTTQKSAKHVHLLFQSTGGTVGDGVCLYNFFKTFPVKLSVYNVGSIQSIAAVAYLGAQDRVVSENAVFSFHRTSVSPQFAMEFALRNYAEAVGIDDRRTEEILRAHIKWGQEKWAHLDRADLWVSAKESVEFGVADRIGSFSPPPGATLYNV